MVSNTRRYVVHPLIIPIELLNVFDVFLPQLLIYPNPTDPLNGQAASLLMHNPDAYKAKIQGQCLYIVLICRDWLASEYVKRFATQDAIDDAEAVDSDDARYCVLIL